MVNNIYPENLKDFISRDKYNKKDIPEDIDSNIDDGQASNLVDACLKYRFENILSRIENDIIELLLDKGNFQFRLAEFLFKYTNILDNDIDKSKFYCFVRDKLGYSIIYLKNLKWIYSKLISFNIFKYGTGTDRQKLFEIGKFIIKRTSEHDYLIIKVMKDIFSDENMIAFFENNDAKEIKKWIKERYEGYFKYFRTSYVPRCILCEVEFNFEDKGKKFDNYAICFNCIDYIKSQEDKKIAILRNKILKIKRQEEIKSLKNQIFELNEKLLDACDVISKLKSHVQELQKNTKS